MWKTSLCKFCSRTMRIIIINWNDFLDKRVLHTVARQFLEEFSTLRNPNWLRGRNYLGEGDFVQRRKLCFQMKFLFFWTLCRIFFDLRSTTYNPFLGYGTVKRCEINLLLYEYGLKKDSQTSAHIKFCRKSARNCRCWWCIHTLTIVVWFWLLPSKKNCNFSLWIGHISPPNINKSAY